MFRVFAERISEIKDNIVERSGLRHFAVQHDRRGRVDDLSVLRSRNRRSCDDIICADRLCQPAVIIPAVKTVCRVRRDDNTDPEDIREVFAGSQFVDA